MREIVIDTETTGLDYRSGDRIIEIAAIELEHFKPTGRRYHRYLNPEREIPIGAYNIHGLTVDFLRRFPVFWQIADEFLVFITGAKLVIHNAAFDLGFINAEFGRIGRPNIWNEYVDTLAVARAKYPGAPASLDALCKRFDISLAGRVMHGAYIDCALLADVYMELFGGKAPTFDLITNHNANPIAEPIRQYRPPRPHAPTDEELAAHLAMLTAERGEFTMRNPMWLSND